MKFLLILWMIASGQAYASGFISQIDQIILNHPESTRSIGGLLSELKAANLDPYDHYSIFSNRVLIFKSYSLQAKAASYLRPRVITYADQGRFLMAYQPDSPCPDGNPDYRCIEVLQMNDVKSRYEFGEIRVRADGQARASTRIFSPTEATLCLACHTGGRPNWDSYRKWPGAYGSNDGELARGSTELAQAVAAMDSWLADPAYNSLELVAEAYKTAPKNRKPTYVQAMMRGGGGPNFQLTAAIADFNVARIYSIIRSKLAYPHYKYAVMGALESCEMLESFIPQAAAHGVTRHFADLYSDTLTVDRLYTEERLASVGDNTNDILDDLELEKIHATPVAGLRYVMQAFDLTADEAPDTWSTAATLSHLRGNEHEVYGFDASIKDPFALLADHVGPDVDGITDCAQLKALSLKSIQ